jgi:hypothetical protein
MPRNDRPGGEQPRLPKPYEFVAIPTNAMDPTGPEGHQHYKESLFTGRITGILTALSPIHVASGTIELTATQPSLVKAHFRVKGRPAIPGSSLKGAIRSIVEAISNPPSCLRVTQARFDNIPNNVRRCANKESLCIACRMFGAMGFLGKISFHDSILQEGRTEIIKIPSFYPARTRERLYFDRGKVKGRKFYRHGNDGLIAAGNVPIESCAVGTCFNLSVDIVNLAKSELALLLFALGQGKPKIYPKIGGGKPACCGSIDVQSINLTMIQPKESFLEFEAIAQTMDLNKILNDTKAISLSIADELGKILAYPGIRPCPGTNY